MAPATPRATLGSPSAFVQLDKRDVISGIGSGYPVDFVRNLQRNLPWAGRYIGHIPGALEAKVEKIIVLYHLVRRVDSPFQAGPLNRLETRLARPANLCLCNRTPVDG